MLAQELESCCLATGRRREGALSLVSDPAESHVFRKVDTGIRKVDQCAIHPPANTALPSSSIVSNVFSFWLSSNNDHVSIDALVSCPACKRKRKQNPKKNVIKPSASKCA